MNTVGTSGWMLAESCVDREGDTLIRISKTIIVLKKNNPKWPLYKHLSNAGDAAALISVEKKLAMVELLNS